MSDHAIKWLIVAQLSCAILYLWTRRQWLARVVHGITFAVVLLALDALLRGL